MKEQPQGNQKIIGHTCISAKVQVIPARSWEPTPVMSDL